MSLRALCACVGLGLVASNGVRDGDSLVQSQVREHHAPAGALAELTTESALSDYLAKAREHSSKQGSEDIVINYEITQLEEGDAIHLVLGPGCDLKFEGSVPIKGSCTVGANLNSDGGKLVESLVKPIGSDDMLKADIKVMPVGLLTWTDVSMNCHFCGNKCAPTSRALGALLNTMVKPFEMPACSEKTNFDMKLTELMPSMPGSGGGMTMHGKMEADFQLARKDGTMILKGHISTQV